MANQALKEALQSKGGADVYATLQNLITIPEEDPKHPNHHEHMQRVDPSHPENVALLASFREHGWVKTEVIGVYKDGKRFVVGNGRRRLTFVRIENKRRKAEKDPRGEIRPRVILSDDPLLTETVGNSMRMDDAPMVKARRFVQLRETMGAQRAAAALGLPLNEANALSLILSAPNPALHAAVNSKSVAVDVALRATKAGSEAVAKVLDIATGDDGKVDGEKAKAAVKANVALRPRARSAHLAQALAKEIAGIDGVSQAVKAIAAWYAGDDDALTGHSQILKAVTSAQEIAKKKGAA